MVIFSYVTTLRDMIFLPRWDFPAALVMFNPQELVRHGYWLVVYIGIPTPLKNLSSSVGMIIPNIWKNQTCFPTTNQV
jgi:hypothetical protein